VNQRVKTLWLQALRSGKYQQTTKCLHREGKGFCCLGVLCDIHRKETGGEWESFGPSGQRMYKHGYDFLPVAVREWAGIETHRPCVTVPGQCLPVYLDHLNDQCKTFAYIADRIEESL
jgi:hypothetical protein